MPNTQTQTVETPANPQTQNIATITLSRSASGIKLYVKSPVLEAFFRSRSDASGYGDAEEWQGRRGYFCSTVTDTGVFGRWGNTASCAPTLDAAGRANLTAFLGHGLTEGYTLTFTNVVISRSTMEAWISKVKESLRRLYVEFISECEWSMEITIRERY